MKIHLDNRAFLIKDMTADDVYSLLSMIKGAGLNERRTFDSLKRQIEELDKNGLLFK